MSLVDDLRARMAKPQRHRLLQGFPALPMMRTAGPRTRAVDGSTWSAEGRTSEALLEVDPARQLIVGVIPHTGCTPSVAGCGFCTFPHDRHTNLNLKQQVEQTLRDVEETFTRVPSLEGRSVAALYFGGATANLAPVAALNEVFTALSKHLDLSRAEVTLEGVPALFRPGKLLGGPMRWLESLAVGQRRLSMGIQTFDAQRVAAMGRTAFGDAKTVKSVVREAHTRGMTTSGDFLLNQPAQSRDAMLDDMKRALECGLDQVCVYHLVAYEGLGTAWSRDAALLASLPSMETASENFIAVRELLVAQGFAQTTLTNFERGEQRFAYERLSFEPRKTDALGFGPVSISTLVNGKAQRGLKLVRAKGTGHRASDLWFPYESRDLDLHYAVRALSGLSVERSLIPDEVAGLLTSLELIRDDGATCTLTPRGMFFADSIAGTLMASRAEELRASSAGVHTNSLLQQPNRAFMG